MSQDSAQSALSAPSISQPPIEGRWLWRRTYVFAATAVLALILARLAERAPDPALPALIRVVAGLIALMAVLYLVAPTAQQLIAFIAQLRAGTGGVK